jgi:hypothetical protein
VVGVAGEIAQQTDLPGRWDRLDRLLSGPEHDPRADAVTLLADADGRGVVRHEMRKIHESGIFAAAVPGSLGD